MAYSKLPPFPPSPSDYETREVWLALADASRKLGELKYLAQTIPNEGILLSALGRQEAQGSSAIENIVTTQQALHQYQVRPDTRDIAAKEASQYAEAMKIGWSEVQKTGLLSCRTIIRIQQILTGRLTQWRELPDTVLKNAAGETVYTPPPPGEVPDMMAQLEKYLNTESGEDPLVKMALAHSRFEAIHPFYDGNGRTGRIVNILFLVKTGLLNAPILYLSRYINQTRGDYYRLLRQTQSGRGWESWLVYMLHGVAATARHTIVLAEKIRDLHNDHEKSIGTMRLFRRRELLDAIFIYPLTTAAVLAKELDISRPTAVRSLDILTANGILEKIKPKRENYYINHKLTALLFTSPDIEL